MKRTLKLSLAALVILTSSSNAIIVHDPVQTSKAVIEYEEVAKRWMERVEQWKEKMSALKDFRLDGNIIDKFKELNSLLALYGLDMGDLDLNNPQSQIGLYAKQLFEFYTLFDDCAYDYLDDNQKKICTNKMVRNVQEIAAMSMLAENMKGFIEKLNTLNDKLAAAEDIKSSQDITSGIQSTISSMKALKIQYEMMTIRNEATRKMEQRQNEQIEKQKRQNSDAFIDQSFL